MLVFHILSLILPLLVTNVLHMFVVKYDYFSFAKYPISKSLFGSNKTYRGLLFISLFNILSFTLIKYLFFDTNIYYDLIIIGFILGLSYSLAELPNSYLKRRLGISPGATSKKNKVIFMLLDKSDSALLSSIVYSLIYGLNLFEWLLLFYVSVLIHISISWLLVLSKIKKAF
ncbi:MAG: CDP-archaeol synthase [Candidatus Kapaibacteriales bacterium]